MENFLIIDGNSIMNRAFYGIPAKSMSLPDGMYTNALYGFLNTYLMIRDMVKPSYIAVSFDISKKTFRNEMYEDYKGTRKGMPEELKIQMPVIKDILRAMNIEIIEKEGYEADDILGTVSKMNSNKGIFTYILTGDRDSFQLISNFVTVVMPSSKLGKTEYTSYTIEKLNEKYGITPNQVIDVKSLMGDSSDNIPGVKGIGEKTAYDLIHKYNSLENIYTNIETLDATPKVIEKLKQDEKMAHLSYTLATINRDVPIDLNYDNCKIKDINKEELFSIFNKLKFNKLMTRFDFSNIDKSTFTNYNIQTTVATQVDNFFSSLNQNEKKLSEKTEIITITENNKDILFNILLNEINLPYIFSITSEKYFSNVLPSSVEYLAIYYNEQIYAIIFDSDEFKKEILNAFAKSKTHKIGYNIKQDMRYFFSIGITDFYGFDYDLMIAYYLIDSGRNKYSFNFLLQYLFNTNFKDTNTESQISLFDSLDKKDEIFDDIFKDNLTIYLKALNYSFEPIINKLDEIGSLELFKNIEIPLSETLASMEYVGMHIDLKKLEEFDIEITSRLISLEQDIYNLAGEEFNINSPKQLGVILFDKLGLPVIRKNKSGYSTDKEVLDELENKHPIIPNILEYRQISKLKSTYVDGLKNAIQKDGRVHTTFMQTVASTGRLSSIEPNLQNIPVRLELGSKIRKFFVGEDDNLILDSDYSQIELRVLASMSDDKLMIEAFNNGVDIHTSTASQVFDLKVEDVTPDLRRKAKAVNFGIVYGISEYGLSKNIDSSVLDAKKYIDNYLNKYNGIKQFMTNVIKEAREKGFVTTLYGRRRYIDELKNINKNVQKLGERMAMNAPIQGTAADIIKVAMNNVYTSIKQHNLKSKLIMQVHDELIVEVVRGEEEIVKNIVKLAMENVLKLKVSLSIDMNIANSWYDAK